MIFLRLSIGGVYLNLKEKVKCLPCSPGVYLMKDSLENIIYVGKSKNLKSRVSSYFTSNKNRTSKIEKLIKNIHDFDIITVDTEFEALLTECKFIKMLKPRYNNLMKNDLRYQYIKVTIKDQYPIIKLSESKLDDGNFYFGPFTNYNNLLNMINFLMDELPLKKCSILFNKNTASTCLNYDLKKCFGVCKYDKHQKEYQELIYKVLDFLSLKNEDLITYFKDKMEYYVESLNFEKAQYLMENMQKLKYLQHELLNIKNLQAKRKLLIMEAYNNRLKVFFVNGKNITFSEVYNLEVQQIEEIKFKIIEKLNKWAKEVQFDKFHTTKFSEDERNMIDEYSIIQKYIKMKNDTSLNYIELKDDFNFKDEHLEEIEYLIRKTLSYTH